MTIGRVQFRAALRLGAGLAAIFAATATHAQEIADAGAEEIVVTGSRPIAESEAAALKTQKESLSLVTVVSSDAVGRLPDQNIAQAVGRLPGVSVERDQGQARYINLRGAPKTWTTLSFDGINVVSPEGRDARYDSIPSAISSQVVVQKAVTADMTGETIAGNVNIITRSPFDYSGFHVAAKAGAGYVELGSRSEYEGALVLSDRFKVGDGEIGVLVSGSYYQRNMITDNFETDFEQVAQDQRPGFAERFWARETENKLYRLTRRNWSMSGKVEWRPDSDNKVAASSIYTIFSDDEMRDNYIFDLDDRQGDLVANTAACATSVNLTPRTTGYADVCIGNTPFSGTEYGVDINQRATLRAFRQSVFTNTLSGSHDRGEWTIRWAGNYTQSKDDRSIVGEMRFDSPSTRNLRPTVTYDFTNPNLSRVQLFTTIANADGTFQAGTPVTAIDSFTKPLSSFRSLDAVDTTDAYTGKLELGRKVSLFGGDGVIRVGVQYDKRTKEAVENELLLNSATQFAAAGINTGYAANSLDIPFKGKIPLGYTFRYFSEDAMRAALASANGIRVFTPVNANYYKVGEEILSAYVLASTKLEWGSIVGGVRAEKVKNSGSAFGGAALIAADSSSTLFFPSLHFNFDVADDKKLRLSFNSGAARADYDQLRPNVTINDTNRTLNGGNPAIKPERAYGADAYFEWYVQPQGYLALGLFYKKAEDVIFNSSGTFGSNALDSGGIDRSQYTFSGLSNGGSGRLFGAEATIQIQLEPYTADLGLPEWAGGFGLSANLTLNDTKVDKPAGPGFPARSLALPGTSDTVYNIGGYYEKYGLSLRLQYQWRSARLDEVADTLVDGGDTYWAADGELDASLRYEVRKGFEVYLDASNLLNEAGRRYSGSSQYTIEWERFGRRYTGGVRVAF